MKNWNLLFRRTHLYLGMLLLPWMLIYALSTVAFNHGELFHGHRPADQQWNQLWEKDYKLELPATDGDLREVARRVLDENGFKGPFGVQRQGQRLTIGMPSFLHPARLVYEVDRKKLRAESRQPTSADVLVRLHTRTGYGRGTWLNNLWAVFVDVFCVTTLIWIATGIYLWWKLPATRLWGFITLAGGAATIVALLFTV